MKNERLYVVGFKGKGQDALYSSEAWCHNDGDGGIRKMTLPQAKRKLKKLSGGPTAIFKLVEVKP